MFKEETPKIATPTQSITQQTDAVSNQIQDSFLESIIQEDVTEKSNDTSDVIDSVFSRISQDDRTAYLLDVDEYNNRAYDRMPRIQRFLILFALPSKTTSRPPR